MLNIISSNHSPTHFIILIFFCLFTVSLIVFFFSVFSSTSGRVHMMFSFYSRRTSKSAPSVDNESVFNQKRLQTLFEEYAGKSCHRSAIAIAFAITSCTNSHVSNVKPLFLLPFHVLVAQSISSTRQPIDRTRRHRTFLQGFACSAGRYCHAGSGLQDGSQTDGLFYVERVDQRLDRFAM